MRPHEALHARQRAVLPRWLATYYEQPIEIVRGEGRTVYDAEGRAYLDCYAGILTTMTGHAVPEVVEAIRAQAGRLLHASTLYLGGPMVELAERIAALSGIPDAKVFFTTSGTEANEAALLLATTWRRSHQVLALRNSYHGRSFAAMGVTGNRGWAASALSPLRTAFVHGGYRFRSPFRGLGDAEYVAACVEDLEDVLATATSGDVACLIAEPIQGVGGFATPPDGLFGAMKQVLDRHGILFVSDEVQTGWGRTGGKMFGIEHWGVEPDVMTFAKGMANGVPIGATIAAPEVADSLQGLTISTFGGNPVTAAAAQATIEVIEEENLVDNARVMGDRLRQGLETLKQKYPVIGDVRGMGLMQALELVGENKKPDTASLKRLFEATKRHGLLIGKGGLWGNVVRIAPPLNVNKDQIDHALQVLDRSFAQMGQ